MFSRFFICFFLCSIFYVTEMFKIRARNAKKLLLFDLLPFAPSLSKIHSLTRPTHIILALFCTIQPCPVSLHTARNRSKINLTCFSSSYSLPATISYVLLCKISMCCHSILKLQSKQITSAKVDEFAIQMKW